MRYLQLLIFVAPLVLTGTLRAHEPARRSRVRTARDYVERSVARARNFGRLHQAKWAAEQFERRGDSNSAIELHREAAARSFSRGDHRSAYYSSVRASELEAAQAQEYSQQSGPAATLRTATALEHAGRAMSEAADAARLWGPEAHSTRATALAAASRHYESAASLFASHPDVTVEMGATSPMVSAANAAERAAELRIEAAAITVAEESARTSTDRARASRLYAAAAGYWMRAGVPMMAAQARIKSREARSPFVLPR